MRRPWFYDQGRLPLTLMNAIGDLESTLADLKPAFAGTYVFACVERIPDGLTPFATVAESAGITVVVKAVEGTEYGLDRSEQFTRISLGVDTSLKAVGITATIAQTLSSRDIPCNVIAGYYQDHLFVPTQQAEEAVRILENLRQQARGWLPR